MKKFLLVALIGLGLTGMALVAGAYTDRTNTCTSAYQLVGQAQVAQALDTAIVRVLGTPTIVLAKSAKNMRTGLSDANLVQARATDVIQFTIEFWNTGEGDADTVILEDLTPAGLTYEAASFGDTHYNCATGVTTVAGSLVTFKATVVNGTLTGAGSGTMTFRATVN